MGLFSRLASMRSSSNEQQVKTSEFAIMAPATGNVVALESTTDPAFSSRAMGDGVAIVPTAGQIVSPVTGTVGAIFPTGHAFAIVTEDGATQVMVHIGIDTVRLKGRGFTTHVAQGDYVRSGQPIVTIDLDEVSAAGFDPTTFVVVCERRANTSVREHEEGSVSAGDELLWLS